MAIRERVVITLVVLTSLFMTCCALIAYWRVSAPSIRQPELNRSSHRRLTHTVDSSSAYISPIAVAETSPKIFLYGTPHTIPTYYAHLVDPLLELIDRVDCVYIEHGNSLTLDLFQACLDEEHFYELPRIEQARLHDLRSVVLLPQDKTLGEVLPGELLSELTFAASRSGLPNEFIYNVIRTDRRAIWTYCFGVFPLEKTNVISVENLVRARALAADVPVYDLESINSYVDVFGSVTIGQQIELLHCSLKPNSRNTEPSQEHSHYDKVLSQFLRKYLDDDSEVPSWKTELFTRLIDDRNQAMFERIEPLIGVQSCLVLVGSAHMGGDAGLISCFRSAGYKVRLVTSIDGKSASTNQTGQDSLTDLRVGTGDTACCWGVRSRRIIGVEEFGTRAVAI